MFIFYYAHANIFGCCFAQKHSELAQWNWDGTDCVWMVPGTFDDDGNTLPQFTEQA